MHLLVQNLGSLSSPRNYLPASGDVISDTRAALYNRVRAKGLMNKGDQEKMCDG